MVFNYQKNWNWKCYFSFIFICGLNISIKGISIVSDIYVHYNYWFPFAWEDHTNDNYNKIADYQRAFERYFHLPVKRFKE